MTVTITWLPKAEQDLADISNYYKHISMSLVEALRLEIEAILTQLQEFPHSYESANATLRRAFLTRYPYVLYFRGTATEVSITAILPQRSNPKTIARQIRLR
jgi:plasmid stabilization system protein ParE